MLEKRDFTRFLSLSRYRNDMRFRFVSDLTRSGTVSQSMGCASWVVHQSCIIKLVDFRWLANGRVFVRSRADRPHVFDLGRSSTSRISPSSDSARFFTLTYTGSEPVRWFTDPLFMLCNTEQYGRGGRAVSSVAAIGFRARLPVFSALRTLGV